MRGGGEFGAAQIALHERLRRVDRVREARGEGARERRAQDARGEIAQIRLRFLLVSYGGSAMLVLLVGFGLIQSAHVHRPREKL